MAKLSTLDVSKAIFATLEDKTDGARDKAIVDVTNFLANKNLLSKAPEILEHLEKLLDEKKGIVRATVSAPHPLSEHRESEIKSLLKKHYGAEHVVLQFKEDKNLIGGIKIEAKDELIDLSLENRMSQLKNHLLQN